MSVGGKVKDCLIFENRVFINTIDGLVECAINVERDSNSETVVPGDFVWWQGNRAFWTTKDKISQVDTVLVRRGFSGVPWPHDMPATKGK